MDLGINGKVFMVAGASSGLGYAIARKLAEEGGKVSIASRSQENIATAAATISEETAAEIRGYVFDVRDANSINRWVEDTQNDFGQIDGLVINAGGPSPGFFEEFDDQAWQSAFELTLLSAVRLIRGALPALKVNGGSILTLTSSAVKEPIDILVMSNVMRSGVNSLVKSLSDDLAGDNVRINNLIPGLINTDRIDALNCFWQSVLIAALRRCDSLLKRPFQWGVMVSQRSLPMPPHSYCPIKPVILPVRRWWLTAVR